MNYSNRSIILVAIQLGTIVLVLLTGPTLARATHYLLLELLGIGVGLWALVTMRRATFSVMPDVKPTGQLIRQGPYRWIRHPMYLALLLVIGALVLDAPSAGRIGIWLILLVDILTKIVHEERLLAAHYPDYGRYQLQTKRLLPYLY